MVLLLSCCYAEMYTFEKVLIYTRAFKDSAACQQCAVLHHAAAAFQLYLNRSYII
jgi:hypothetical protein